MVAAAAGLALVATQTPDGLGLTPVEGARFFVFSGRFVSEGGAGARSFGVLACELIFNSVIFGAVVPCPEDVERVFPVEPFAPFVTMPGYGLDTLPDVTYPFIRYGRYKG